MTDGKKAIATLAGLKMMVGTKAKEVCDVAISALQEREERSKGCEYCADHKYNVEDCVMLSHDKSDFDSGMYIYDGELISNSGEFQCVRINFCPMCGRPLKGEDND